VNVPEHLTSNKEPLTSRMQFDMERQKRESEKLANYLWENYIEPFDHDLIFFIGVGNAFHGLARLLVEQSLAPQTPPVTCANLLMDPSRRSLLTPGWHHCVRCRQSDSPCPLSRKSLPLHVVLAEQSDIRLGAAQRMARKTQNIQAIRQIDTIT
jgi:hypothetical protein